MVGVPSSAGGDRFFAQKKLSSNQCVYSFMAKPADVSTKRLISLAPNNWVKWVTQIPREHLTGKEYRHFGFQSIC
ncbi:MAG: hypothetical protein ACKO3K_04880 [Cuspidothrix sp.]